MLVTTDPHDGQTARPMLPLWLPDDPHIYFLTHHSSQKLAHIAGEPCVALIIMRDRSYFVVHGAAHASRDRELIRRLWHPSYRAWFPGGKDDREAAVLQVDIESVNYWEPPRSQFVRVFQAMKAIVTRRGIETPMKTIDGL